MLTRDILEDRRLAGIPRMATPGIHVEVLEVRAERWTWDEFEGRLLEKYELHDVLRLSKRDFMELVETPEKGRNASVLLREFEERFARLSDRTGQKSCPFICQICRCTGPRASGSPVGIDDGLTTD